VEHQATVQLHVPVQDARPGTIRVSHRRELALRRVGDIKGNVGIALRRSRCLAAVGVDEPAPGAGSDCLPTGEHAGLEVVHHEHPVVPPHRNLRVVVAPGEEQAQCGAHDQRPHHARTPAFQDLSYEPGSTNRSHSAEQSAAQDGGTACAHRPLGLSVFASAILILRRTVGQGDQRESSILGRARIASAAQPASVARRSSLPPMHPDTAAVMPHTSSALLLAPLKRRSPSSGLGRSLGTSRRRHRA
jgi:hypothetical protein